MTWLLTQFMANTLSNSSWKHMKCSLIATDNDELFLACFFASIHSSTEVFPIISCGVGRADGSPDETRSPLSELGRKVLTMALVLVEACVKVGKRWLVLIVSDCG